MDAEAGERLLGGSVMLDVRLDGWVGGWMIRTGGWMGSMGAQMSSG